MSIETRGFFTHTRAVTWSEGLLLGNGSIGAIVMGQPHKECVMISHEEFFLPLFEQMPVLEMSDMLPELRELIKAGRGGEANRRVVEAARKAGYPAEFLMTDPFHPGFDLLVDTGPETAVEDYRRGVNFSTGEAFVEFVGADGHACRRRGFISRAEHVLVMEWQAENRPVNADISLGMRPSLMEPWEKGVTSPGNIPKGSFVQRGIRAMENKVDGEFLAYRAAYAMTDGGYEGIARVHAPGGSLERRGNSIRVRGAQHLLILLTLTPLRDYEQSELPALRRKLEALPHVYEHLLAPHVSAHGDLFNRVRLTLAEPVEAAADTPVETHLARAREGEAEAAWLQKVFDACRYNIISSTGTLPPNLQGIWTGTWTPHWSGDYTLDANVQAAIAHYLACGTPELMRSLFRLLDRMLPDFRENARALYNARGLFVNSRVSRHGLQQRYNYCPVFFWTAGGAWLAHYYYAYYEYTGDREFLRQTALPFMREAARFFLDFLIKDENGRYQFNPSYSPENHPANSDSPAAINATMDIAAVRELLTNLVDACGVLEMDDPELSAWQEMLGSLPPYLANEDGALKEWSAPGVNDNYSHRHMSHLYPLYPGSEAEPDGNGQLYTLCRQALRMRLQHYDPRDYGGFGLYHLAMAAARAGDAESALDALDYMLGEHIYTGMGTAHNPGPSIFNMDASGGIPAVVVEMLVVSRTGGLELLPAAVGPLQAGRIQGIQCRGQIAVEQMQWDVGKGRLRCRLRSDKAQSFHVLVPKRFNHPQTVKGVVKECGEQHGKTLLRVEVAADRKVEFNFYV